MIEAEKDRVASIDGKASDLDSDQPSGLIPVISESWRSFFKWRGRGPIPPAEREKLQSFVKRARRARTPHSILGGPRQPDHLAGALRGQCRPDQYRQSPRRRRVPADRKAVVAFAMR